jgi:hypothetical protein
VRYFGNPCTPKVREAMTNGELGVILTPNQGNRLPDGATWIADNGCFSTNYVGDIAWLDWLTKHSPDAGRCLFATAPDVVGDAETTLKRSAPFLPVIRRLGYPAALVAQDGLEDLEVPWDTFDALFIGGSTEWKLGPAAAAIAKEAKTRGKYVHMGRVNSRQRWTYAESIGCDSVDGTYLAFGPETNLPKLMRWVDQGSLFGGAA